MTDARVQSMTFDSVDPDYSGEMTMVVTFEDRDDGTEVTIAFEGIPREFDPRTMMRALGRHLKS
jgi:Activator of Hsp90 ATPase homolog 1-like protein